MLPVFRPAGRQAAAAFLVVKEVVLLSYAPKLAAALSGATIRQLAYWRKPGPDGQPILAPEYSATRPIDYSFRDVIALRTCVRLRQEASLQKIRRALDTLRVDLGLGDHLSSYRLVADGSTIYLADSDHAVISCGKRAMWSSMSSSKCFRPLSRVTLTTLRPTSTAT
jgi:hypothetical protein